MDWSCAVNLKVSLPLHSIFFRFVVVVVLFSYRHVQTLPKIHLCTFCVCVCVWGQNSIFESKVQWSISNDLGAEFQDNSGEQKVWASGRSDGVWVCYAFVIYKWKNTAHVSVLIHHGLPRVKWCMEFKASVTNSSKHTLFPSPALLPILAVLISYCPVNLYFNLLLPSCFCCFGFFLFVCCCFLHILSYHLCHISFFWQSSLCSGLDFLSHSDVILSVYLNQHKAEQQKHCGVGKRHISMSVQWWIRMLKCSREKPDTLHFSIWHRVHEFAFLCNLTAQRWNNKNSWHVFFLIPRISASFFSFATHGFSNVLFQYMLM